MRHTKIPKTHAMVTVEFIFIDFLRLVLSQWLERQISRRVEARRFYCGRNTKDVWQQRQEVVVIDIRRQSYTKDLEDGVNSNQKDSDDSHALA